MKRRPVGDRLVDVPETVFACDFSDDPDPLARACAPEQPGAVAVGQEWMNPSTGTILPVLRVREGQVDLASTTYTVVLTHAQLRAGWVCIDLPSPTPAAEISKGRTT